MQTHLSKTADQYVTENKLLGKFTPTNALRHYQLFRSIESYCCVSLENVTPSQISDYLAQPNMRKSKKDGPKKPKPRDRMSIWKYHNMVRNFFIWLSERAEVSDEIIDFFSKALFPWRLNAVPTYTREEIKLIFKAARCHKRVCMAARNTMILAIAYCMTIRTAAISAIRLNDVDLEKAVIRVKDKNQKVHSAMIPFKLVPALREYIEKHRPQLCRPTHHQSDYLFISTRNGSRFSNKGMLDILDTILTNAEIDRQTLRGLHGLRRAGATHQHQDGTPLHILMGIMGQDDIKSTSLYIGSDEKLVGKLVEGSSSLTHINLHTLRKAQRDHEKEMARKRATP